MLAKAEQMNTLAELGKRKQYENLIEDIYTKIKNSAEKGLFSLMLKIEEDKYGKEKVEELMKLLRGDGFKVFVSGSSFFGRYTHIRVRWD